MRSSHLHLKTLLPTLLCAFAVQLTACSSVQTYNIPQTQQTLGEAIKRSDDLMQKAQMDFDEKKQLTANLSRSKNAGFRKHENDLRGLLASMQTHLNTINGQRKRMAAANSEVASLGYNRSELRADEPGYESIQVAVDEFQEAAESTNRAMELYSKDSNAFTAVIERSKLLMQFTSSDFIPRLQSSVQKAQEAATNMQHELDRAEQRLVHSQTDSAHRRTLENITTDMGSFAEGYTRKAQRYQGIAKEIRDVTGDGRITSLDPEWPHVQKLLREYEQVNAELVQIQAQFNASLERFRRQSK